MIRYFKDKLNESGNGPVNIPNSSAEYMYIGEFCYIAVKDPDKDWLNLGLEEVSEEFLVGKTDRVSKTAFVAQKTNEPLGELEVEENPDKDLKCEEI